MTKDVNFLFPFSTKEETLEKITKILKYALTLQWNCFQRGFTIIYSSATNLAAYLRSGN